MKSAKQRTTLTDLREPQQLRELNRQLSWIWDQLLGGLNMKSLDADTRGIIESKVGSDELESAIRQSEDEILLEVRKPASAIDTGNGIVINEKGVEITAGGGGQYIRITDELIEATDIRSATVSPRYAGARMITVNPNATAEQMQQSGVFRSIADVFAQLNGRQLEGKVMIVCAEEAVMYGDIGLSGVCGGEIEILGAGMTLYGALSVSGCSGRIRMESMKIVPSAGIGLNVRGCTYISLQECSVSGVGADALYIGDGSRVHCVGCTLISEGGCAAFTASASLGVFADCIGTGALAVFSASLAAQGKVPDGGCADWGGSFISAKDVIPTGADGQPSAPSVLTKEYTMLNSDSYRGGWSYFSDSDIRQGYVSSGRIRGCMWFDNALLRSELEGKTIKQASLRLFAMKNVGRGTAVDVELYGTAMEYAGRSGAPALTASYGLIGSFTPGEAATVTIPTQVVDDIAAGRINALMVYSSDTALYGERDYSRNYARFAGQTSAEEDTVPILTVTYQ